MSTIRTSLIRLAAVNVSAAVVASGAAGVANAQGGSLTRAVLVDLAPQLGTSVQGSVDAAPTAPASVTDSVGTVTGSMVDATAEAAGSAAGSVADATSGSTGTGVLGELIGALPGSIEMAVGSGEAPGSIFYPTFGSLNAMSTNTSPTTASAMEAVQGSVYSPLGQASVEAGSAEPSTGSFAIPLVPAGSLGIPWDLFWAGSYGDYLTGASTQLLVSSLGVDQGSMVGSLPMLSVAGSIIGGVVLATGAPLPALPSVQLPALPGLPSGSAAARVQAAPVQAAPVQAPGPDMNNGRG